MKLYIYDHCPYCVKARMIFGLKGVSVKNITLLNDDDKTPISMIGKKMVPILEHAKGKYMPESLDIIRYIDDHWGKPSIIWREDSRLSSWLDKVSDVCYFLAMPRWVKAPLAEFKTKGAKACFQKKKERMIGSFKSALKETDDLKTETEIYLKKLEKLMDKPLFFKKTLSVNDFHLFACLRSLSIVKGLRFPKKVDRYMKNMSVKSRIPLHHNIAL